jgi:hypothetical protein
LSDSKSAGSSGAVNENVGSTNGLAMIANLMDLKFNSVELLV